MFALWSGDAPYIDGKKWIKIDYKLYRHVTCWRIFGHWAIQFCTVVNQADDAESINPFWFNYFWDSIKIHPVDSFISNRPTFYILFLLFFFLFFISTRSPLGTPKSGPAACEADGLWTHRDVALETFGRSEGQAAGGCHCGPTKAGRREGCSKAVFGGGNSPR